MRYAGLEEYEVAPGRSEIQFQVAKHPEPLLPFLSHLPCDSGDVARILQTGGGGDNRQPIEQMRIVQSLACCKKFTLFCCRSDAPIPIQIYMISFTDLSYRPSNLDGS